MAPGSKTGAGPAWLVGTPRHFTPSAALARSLGPPASSPAGAAEENKTILPCSSSLHTVGSYASSHTGGGAVSVNRGAVEVLNLEIRNSFYTILYRYFINFFLLISFFIAGISKL